MRQEPAVIIAAVLAIANVILGVAVDSVADWIAWLQSGILVVAGVAIRALTYSKDFVERHRPPSASV